MSRLSSILVVFSLVADINAVTLHSIGYCTPTALYFLGYCRPTRGRPSHTDFTVECFFKCLWKTESRFFIIIA